MRYKPFSVLWVLFLFFGQVELAHGEADDSVEIMGDCRVDLELKPGQGCTTPDGGTFSIDTDRCALARSAGPFTSTNYWQAKDDSTRCESENGEYVAVRISSDPLTWRMDSVASLGESIIADCRVGLELKPGQGCTVPEKGVFSIRTNGCVGAMPSISGEVSISNISSGCIQGGWGAGEFAASRISSDSSTWRIDSVPLEKPD